MNSEKDFYVKQRTSQFLRQNPVDANDIKIQRRVKMPDWRAF
jgi:hypothetical protein